MIKHIHLVECHSTQDILKEQLDQDSDNESYLISCESQTAGRGRNERIWVDMPGTLCFSLNIKAHPMMSMTALEVSVLVAKFCEENLSSRTALKWPNDLLDADLKKCCGILIQGSHQNFLAGVGLNFFSHDPLFGGLSSTARELDKKSLALQMAQFIHAHRYLDADTLIQDWESRCSHMNQRVSVTENEDITIGTFLGLGKNGEARVQTETGEKNLFNGTLRLI